MPSSFWSSTRMRRSSLWALRRAEEHAVGHDHRGAAAGLEQPEEQGEEEQLGLLRLDDLEEVLGGALVVERSGERRVGEDEACRPRSSPAWSSASESGSDVGVLDAVQQHVHAADAQHRVVEVVAVEHLVVEVLRLSFGSRSALGMVVAEVLAGGDEEAAGAARRVADHVGRRRRGHLDHQLDDVARRAELAVLPGGGDLARACTRRRRPWCRGPPSGCASSPSTAFCSSAGVGIVNRASFMCVGVGGAVAAERAQEREDVLADDRRTCRLGAKFLKRSPAQVVVGAADVVSSGVAVGEDRVARSARRVRLALFSARVWSSSRPLDEQQVGDLLHHLERVGDAARPEVVPDPRRSCDLSSPVNTVVFSRPGRLQQAAPRPWCSMTLRDDCRMAPRPTPSTPSAAPRSTSGSRGTLRFRCRLR